MTTISESGTEADSNKFIENDYLRIDGGIITEIERVDKLDIRGHPSKIKIHVSEPDGVGPWSYEEPDIVTWDEDNCWLVELAKKRGYGLKNLDMLEGEEVYIEPNEDGGNWSMCSDYPDEMFDEDKISDSVKIEGKETIDKRERVSEDEDIEKECMEYETVGDYFVCKIDELVEIERDGACNVIEITVDTPYDEGVWEFKKPYVWNDDDPLVKLCESRNYGHGNFTSIAGDEVLVTRKGNEWVIQTSPPEHYRNNSTPSTQERNHMPEERTICIGLALLSILVLMVYIATTI
jgi:hypothetical protein